MDDVWPEKLDYSMSIPTKGVVFGSAIRVDFKMIPLTKGLMIKSISSDLVEIRHLRFIRCPRRNRIHRVIVQNEWVLPDDMETVEIDGQYGYRFHRLIQIPKSLNGCIQSVNTRGIEVKHMIKFTMRLRNPDEHQSEVWMPLSSHAFELPFGLRTQIHATLPIFIFISPHLALDDDNSIIGDPNRTPSIADMLNTAVPPLYGAHQFDQLYSDVDTSGYMTPAGGTSGLNTPFVSTSRSTSTDNLVSMGTQAPRGFVASVLQIRLHNLSTIFNVFSDEGSPSEGEPAVNTSPAVNSPSTVGTPSAVDAPSAVNASPAQEDIAATPTHVTPQHIEFSTEALSKVPSYNTARNSRPPALIHDGLPSYESAIHAPVGPAVLSPTPDEASPGVGHQDPAPE